MGYEARAVREVAESSYQAVPRLQVVAERDATVPPDLDAIEELGDEIATLARTSTRPPTAYWF